MRFYSNIDARLTLSQAPDLAASVQRCCHSNGICVACPNMYAADWQGVL